MRKKWKKLVSLVLAGALVVTMTEFGSSSMTGAEPIPQEENQKTDYDNQLFTDLFAANQLQYDTEKIEATAKTLEKEKGVLFSGTLAGESIEITKEFDFNRSYINRISIDAFSKKGTKVQLGIYVDSMEEPIGTIWLYRQKKKNDWSYSRSVSVDVDQYKLVGKHKVYLKVLETSEENTEVFIRSIEFVESSVPVVYFNIDESEGSIGEMNASSDHSVECYGSMTVQIPEGYNGEYNKKPLKTETYEMEYIRGRGNSTWDPDKKPYKIKLQDKQDVLGMGKNKHWVLLANYYDNSLLRNKITYWLGEQVGMEFTPKCVPVDVIMNGDYLGSYLLSEQIRVGKTRVNIDDLEDNEETKMSTDPEIISGGYLLGMSPYGDDEVQFLTKRGESFELENPSFEDYMNETQYNYIKNYVQQVENAIYGKEFRDGNGVSYKDLMDIKSTAMYYWFQEFSKNGDGYASPSTYLYKKRNDKLYWGPLWDFDYVAWGSTEYNEPYVTGWSHNESVWFSQMFKDPEFAAEVVNAWPILKEKLMELVREGGQLDQYAEQMKVTAKYNFEKWGMSDLGDLDENTKTLTYEEEIERLRQWILQRMEWVDENVQKLYPVECQVKFVADGKTIATQTEYVGKPLSAQPKVPEKKGFVFVGWNTQYHLTYEEYLQYNNMTAKDLENVWEKEEIENLKKNGYTYQGEFFEEDGIPKSITLTASYLPESEIVKPQKIYLSKELICCSEDSRDDISLSVQAVPFDALVKELTWTSSNEKVAQVENGNVKIVGAGKADITVTTTNGKKAVCKVVVLTSEEMEKENHWDYNTEITNPEITLNVGQYGKINVGYSIEEPQNVYDYFYYNSASPDIVEVGEHGVIFGAKEGKTVIIVKGETGECMTCSVTVVNPNKISVNQIYTVNGLKYRVLSYHGKIAEITCIGATNAKLKKLKIPASVTIKGKKFKVVKIASKAFSGYKNLESVILENGISFIGKEAFANCKKLQKIKIAKSVQVIYSKAFYGDKKLKKIYIRGKRVKINSKAFRKIAKKAKFKVPKNAKKYYKMILKKKKL
ncbi:MAG: CotH kinase family protein [Eubacterium sp.]|nr:CotH kinase family protein [Eubacterium sp.]